MRARAQTGKQNPRRAMEAALLSAMGHVLRAPELDIPIRQRAKFEGWLKIQLAHRLESRHRLTVRLEAGYKGAKGLHRADLLVEDGRQFQAWVMLKTCNTIFRFPGVAVSMRPITRTIVEIADDVRKLAGRSSAKSEGYVCFVMFPVAAQPRRREQQLDRYLRRIGAAGCTWVGRGYARRSEDFGLAHFLGRVSWG